ncbi:MAG: glycosyltransferase family 39 protein [Thermomicrobiales bacterium]
MNGIAMSSLLFVPGPGVEATAEVPERQPAPRRPEPGRDWHRTARADGPNPRRAARTCALLALAAFALIVGSNLLLDRFPTRVHIVSDGTTLTVSAGGTTETVPLTTPLQSVRVPAAEPYKREYPIDGSDSTNYWTFYAAHFEAIANSPYYRFQSWLRDDGTYSSWRNLTVRDRDGQPVIAQSRPVEDVPQPLPAAFDLAVDLHRIEVIRDLQFSGADGSTMTISLNRNDKDVRVAQASPGLPEKLLAHWYFSSEWGPELAEVLYLALRTVAIALLLTLLAIPLAALLPAQLPLPARRGTRLAILAGALLVAFAASVYTTVALFDRLPLIEDAQSYYFQAKTFAAGMLASPIPARAEAFEVHFTTTHDGKWFSMYTPGTALVLAIGLKLGAGWLVGPCLATGGLLLTYGAARRQFGARTALLAAILMASSPFLHLQAGTFMSHVPAMFWGALLLYAAVRYDERRAPGWAALAAAALGMLFLTRELSAIVYAATVGTFLAWRAVTIALRVASERRRLARGIAAAVAGLAPFVAAYLLYNRALTGSALLLPRTVFSATENRYGFGEGVGFFGRHTLGGGLVNADEMLTSLAITLFGWPFYLALAAMVLPFVLRRARAWDALHGALALGFVLAYIGLYYHGITYGPRYYLDALPALVLLAARGFVALAETAAALCQDWGRTRARDRANLAAFLLVVALLACNALYFWPQQTRLYRLQGRPGISKVAFGAFIEQRFSGPASALTNAAVIVRQPSQWPLLEPLNCPRLDCDTIFVLSPDPTFDGDLRAAYPGREWYVAREADGVLDVDPLGADGPPPGR